jgi:hypothetical protein
MRPELPGLNSQADDTPDTGLPQGHLGLDRWPGFTSPLPSVPLQSWWSAVKSYPLTSWDQVAMPLEVARPPSCRVGVIIPKARQC